MKNLLKTAFLWFAKRRLAYLFLWVLPNDVCVDPRKNVCFLKQSMGLIFGKFARFSSYHHPIRRRVFVKPLKGNCRLLTLDLDVNEFTQCGYYFSNLDAPLIRLINKGGFSFVDVGANIGLYSLIAGFSFERIYSFEPSKFTYELLLRNIRSNGLDSIFAVNCALSDKSSRALLYLNPFNNGGASLREFSSALRSEFGNYKWAEIDVELMPLDNFVLDHSVESVDLIKIDVEGHELEVIRGARTTVLNFRPLMYVEISSNQAKLEEILEELPSDYVPYSIIENAVISLSDRLPHDVPLCPNEKLPQLLSP
jgi:FkbM family methyltransferase